MTVLKICGIRFKINWLFLVIILLFALVGDLARALTAFTVVFLHELGHVLTAVFYKLRVKEIELLPFGGVAVFEDFLEVNPTIERRVALAGPLVNFLLALSAVLLTRYGVLALETALFFVSLNLQIGIFNLIPALPLDGGRILRATLMKSGGYREATHQTLKLTRVVAVLAGFWAFFSWLLGKANPLSMLAAFFVYFAALKEQEQSFFVLLNYLTRKKSLLDREELILNQDYLVLGDTLVMNALKVINPRTFVHFLIYDRDYHILGKLTEIEVMDAFFALGQNVPMKDLLKKGI